MTKEHELWKFISERLLRNEPVLLLVVAESSGSSPGRQGYKMAVGADGELIGSIGGGLMEVNLVEESRVFLRDAETRGRSHAGTQLSEQVHQKNSPNASGMICSGKQTVVFKLLTHHDAIVVDAIIDVLRNRRPDVLRISPTEFSVDVLSRENHPAAKAAPLLRKEGSRTRNDFTFEKLAGTDFMFTERIGFKNHLCIIGGGHCSLALSELMSKMDFHITVFDDRPQLNTIDKNRFAHRVMLIEDYDRIGDHIPHGENVYVVVMTLGYESDAQVIRALIDRDLKYFGVLGSNAKMSVMLKSLIKEGLPVERLDRIHTPVGLPINSRTPEEIAVSIAAEIISVKNAG